MTVEEMIIQVRVTAEGVKQGVAVATTELKKLEDQKKKLQDDLKIKVSAPELVKLRGDLAELEAKKKELEKSIKFSVESENVRELKQTLAEIETEKAKLEQKLEIHMELPEHIETINRLEELETVKKELSTELSIAIKTDAEAPKAQLNEINAEINKIKGEIVTIEMRADGVVETTNALKETDQAIREVGKSASDMENQFPKVAAVATAAFAAIVVAIKSGTDAFNNYTVSMNGLISQMEYLGESTGDAIDIVKEKTKDGLMSDGDIARTIRLLTEFGFTLEGAAEMTDLLKDSATYGRKENIALGEAVKRTAQGILTGSTIMAKSAGVMKSLSDMEKEYAASLGKTTDELTKSEKAHAVLVGYREETAKSLGDAAEYAKELGGAQAALTNETEKLAVAFGESLAPLIQEVAEMLTVVVKAIREFVEGNKELVAVITVGIGVYTGLIAILGAVKAAKTAAALAVKAFAVAEGEATAATMGFSGALATLALNPFVLAITALIATIALVAAETKKYKEEQEELNRKKEDYINLLQQEANFENASARQTAIDDMEKLVGQYDELIQKQEALIRQQEDFNAAVAGQAEFDFEAHFNQIEAGVVKVELAYEELIKQAEVYNIYADKTLSVEEDIARIRKLLVDEIQKQKLAIFALNHAVDENIEAMDLSAEGLKKLIKPTQDLIAAQEKLMKGEDLSADTLLELIELYPSVAKHIADNVNWRETLIDVIDKEANKSKEASIATLEQKKNELLMEQLRLDTLKSSYLWEKQSLENRIANYEAAIKAIGNISAKPPEEKEEPAAKYENKLLDEQIKLLNDKIALTEMSTQAQIDGYLALQKYIKTPEEQVENDKKVYALRRQLNDEWYKDEMAVIEKLNRGREDNTDFAGIINKLQETKEKAIEIYADYPESLKKIEQEIDDLMLGRAEDRANKLLAIAAKSVDDQIAEQERLIQQAKLRAGIIEAGVEFKFGSADEIEYVKEIERINEERIANLEALEKELTNAEYEELQVRYTKRKQYAERIEDLGVTAIKEAQEAEKKATEELKKKLEQRIKDQEAAAKKINKIYIDGIKDRYKEEIRLAEEAANSEIAIYTDKIKAIDDLLKSESRADADEEALDKIKRLEEQLKFEKDDTNIYELEKQIALEQAEFDKRKRKESLEDEKASLQEQINAVKDNLSKQKQALQDLRDEEIKLAEESLEKYIEDLKAKQIEKEKFAAEETKILKDELINQQKDSKTFMDKEYENQVQAQKDKRTLLQRTTENIISDLYSKISDFASAGRAAGQAWADAYNSVASGISASVSSYQTSAAPASSSSSETKNSIQVQNTFTMPVATPSKVAAETAYMLELALRNM